MKNAELLVQIHAKILMTRIDSVLYNASKDVSVMKDMSETMKAIVFYQLSAMKV